MLEEIIELVSEDAKALGCWKEIQHTRKIMKQGTSADRQLQVHADAVADGATDKEALDKVVKFLIEETARGV